MFHPRQDHQHPVFPALWHHSRASKADLHAKTFFPAVAEQFGEALHGRTTGLRNADNDLKMSQVNNQVHTTSQVFTGGGYDILADIFEDYKKTRVNDQAEKQIRVGK